MWCGLQRHPLSSRGPTDEVVSACCDSVQDSQRLASLVRLADYMLVEGSLQLLEHTLVELRDTCQDKAVFSLEVNFAEEGMAFAPQEEQVTQVLLCNTAR